MAKHRDIIVKPPRKIKEVPGPAPGASAPRKIGIVTGKARIRPARALPIKARGPIKVGAAPRGAERRFKPGLPKTAAPPKQFRKERPIKLRANALTVGGSHNGSVEMVSGLGKMPVAGAIKFGGNPGPSIAPVVSLLARPKFPEAAKGIKKAIEVTVPPFALPRQP